MATPGVSRRNEPGGPGLIKICGLSTVETLDAALDAGADLIGLVRFANSPRHVDLHQGAALAAHARGRAQRVVLTVDAGDAELDEIVAAMRPDMLQLHGSETPARVGEVARRYRLPVLKAIGISTSADLAAIARYRDVTDYILLDAKPDPAALLPGGNGIPFDWNLLRGLDPGIRCMLSGGLTPDNVAKAIALTGARAVDVSSGVESSRGVKDPALIRAFTANARAAWRATA